MTITLKQNNGISCAVVQCDGVIINDAQSALDFIMSVAYEVGCRRIAVSKDALAEDFFDLHSGLAGEVLQKCVNYRIKFAIIGDFSNYTSESLKDFIYESNKGREIFFAATEAQAIEYLTKPL